VAGEVDIYTAPALRERLVALLADGQARIVVDLTRVDFMDSTGLGVLVGALKRAKERDGRLVLAGAHGTVQRVLGVTGLDRVFEMRATVEEATATP
jgi:anti-sigma B factor antagonist